MSQSETVLAAAEADFAACQTESQLQGVYKKHLSYCKEVRGDQAALRALAATYYEKFRLTVEQTVTDGLLPTPPVGERVQWYENGRVDRPRAAVVLNQVEPGRVDLTIWLPDGTQDYKKGVWHKSHPLHANHANPNTVRFGSWDYLPGRNQPKADKSLAKQIKESQSRIREEARRTMDKQQQLAEARKAALQADASDPSNARPGETPEPQDI